jgi:hypothetical protein
MITTIVHNTDDEPAGKIGITGTDMNGNEIVEFIAAPNIGETSATTKEFKTLKYMVWKWEDEKGKVHIVYEPPRGWKMVERKLRNSYCRTKWFIVGLFHKDDPDWEK